MEKRGRLEKCKENGSKGWIWWKKETLEEKSYQRSI